SFIPGIMSRASPMSTQTGSASIINSTALRFASSITSLMLAGSIICVHSCEFDCSSPLGFNCTLDKGDTLFEGRLLGDVRNVVKPNLYRDSVQLLHLSEEAKRIDGIKDAAVVMGTTTNKEILEKLGLLTEDGRRASENDMILAAKIGSPTLAEVALQHLERIILRPPETDHKSLNLDEGM